MKLLVATLFCASFALAADAPVAKFGCDIQFGQVGSLNEGWWRVHTTMTDIHGVTHRRLSVYKADDGGKAFNLCWKHFRRQMPRHSWWRRFLGL